MSAAAPQSWFRRLFTLRNAVKVVLWTITLIILFYVEEDWRGAREWAATKAEWEAKGESFDFAKLIPPPVPDSENLAMLPMFAWKPDPTRPSYWHTNAFLQAIHSRPFLSYKRSEQVGDFKNLKEALAANYREVFPVAQIPQDPLEQFDQLYPEMVELRSAALTCRYCRLPQDYPPQPPFTRLVDLVSGQMTLVRMLSLHSDLALAGSRPKLALDDIRTNLKLIEGLTKEPFLVSGLEAIGLNAINLSVVYDGLTRRSWNEQQLEELGHALGQIDFLADYKRVLRGELLVSLFIQDEARAGHPIRVPSGSGEKEESLTGASLYPIFWPNGWIDAQKATITSLDLSALRFVNLEKRMVAPQVADQMDGTPNFMPAVAIKFSREQVRVDETCIACALERYRLTLGTYPEALAVLETAGLGPVPHDIMNGEAYRYRLKADGTFLLYSVGWNQKDDGGVVVHKKDSPQVEEPTQGDWVWPAQKPVGH